jgi:hypothetical protein
MDLVGDDLTAAVVASFDSSPNPRTKAVMGALVRHLHAFAREVDLTEEEYFTAIDFLTRTGKATSGNRQEFVLLADVLGVSMLTVGLGNPKPNEATESTVFGPFFIEGSPEIELGADLANGAPGQPCLVTGRVLDTNGNPIGGARVETWQADEDGFYDVQEKHHRSAEPWAPDDRCRGQLLVLGGPAGGLPPRPGGCPRRGSRRTDGVVLDRQRCNTRHELRLALTTWPVGIEGQSTSGGRVALGRSWEAGTAC